MASKYSHTQSDGIYKILREEVVVATYDPATEELAYTSKDFEKYSGSVESEVKAILAEKPDEKATDKPKELENPSPPDTDKPLPQGPATGPTGNSGQNPTPGDAATGPTGSQPAGETDDKATISSLRSQNRHLQAENARLRDEVVKLRANKLLAHTPERFADEVDLTGAPDQDPNLGDLTPAFVDWARENFEPEVFERRYAGRLPK